MQTTPRPRYVLFGLRSGSELAPAELPEADGPAGAASRRDRLPGQLAGVEKSGALYPADRVGRAVRLRGSFRMDILRELLEDDYR